MKRLGAAGTSLTPPVNGTSAQTGAPPPTVESALANSPRRRDALTGTMIALSALIACTIGYLALTVPGAWFPRSSPMSWNVSNLTVMRGTGRVVGDELVMTAPDSNDITLVTVTSEFRSAEYASVAWKVTGVPDDADVRLLWRSDVRPDKLNATTIPATGGRVLRADVAKNPAWLGRITGLALAIHGPLAQPVHIRGVIASPMGAGEIIRDRVGEWFAFEAWNGASINTIVGGADSQAVPLPALLALIVGLSGVAVAVIRRWRPAAVRVATSSMVAAFFLAGWFVLDARWTWNLARQEHATATRYAGKDARDKHFASEDGPLFAFIEKVRAVLPRTPVRIIVAADADYFRGRAAYHLYPNSVYFNPRSNELPPPTAFHSGDWLFVFQRRGIQFDKAEEKLRWDGGPPLRAELKLMEPGAALFVIR